MKNCLTEAIKHSNVYILIFTDDGLSGLFFPHFIWRFNDEFYHYTTSEIIISRVFYEGKIKKLNLAIYEKKRSFIRLRIK